MNETYMPGYPTIPEHPIVIGIPIYGTRFWTWMNNDIPVITTPEAGVDSWNVGTLHRKLLAAAAYSPVVVVDGSETTFTTEAMRVLDEVGRKMEDAGGELRVVMASSRRIYYLQIVNCHRHLQPYLNLFEALRAPYHAAESQPMAA